MKTNLTPVFSPLRPQINRNPVKILSEISVWIYWFDMPIIFVARRIRRQSSQLNTVSGEQVYAMCSRNSKMYRTARFYSPCANTMAIEWNFWDLRTFHWLDKI